MALPLSTYKGFSLYQAALAISARKPPLTPVIATIPALGIVEGIRCRENDAMKIECPNCKLSGEVNDHDVPLDGRYIDCPRCKTGFHIKKPLAKGWNPNMMSACPSCQYSTFTDEMFDVCPKCGLKGSEHNSQKRQQGEQALSKADQDKLNRSLRPDNFVKPPVKDIESDVFRTPPLVRNTSIGIFAVACIVAFYGFIELITYNGDAIFAKINEESLEPVSRNRIFLTHGLLPVVLSVYGGLMAILAVMLHRNMKGGLKGIEIGAWLGLGIGIAYEVNDFIAYIGRSSESPSLAYYLVGLMNSALMLSVWVSLPLGVIWWVRSDRFLSEMNRG